MLYHISEEKGIKEFIPRQVPNNVWGRGDKFVWAINEQHLPNYLFPRDCPRVTYFKNVNTTVSDIDKYLIDKTIDKVIAIEKKWYDAILNNKIIKYSFNEDGFELIDDIAGYYVNRNIVLPVAEEEISNPLEYLLNYNIELRICPSLWELRERVIHSTLGFSIIRMRNASIPIGGIEQYYPLPEKSEPKK